MQRLSKSNIENEKAKIAIIGCGQVDRFHEEHSYHHGSNFYTIDINRNVFPDRVADITDSSKFSHLHDQFELTIAEFLPFFSYNKFGPPNKHEKGFPPKDNDTFSLNMCGVFYKGEKGFAALWDMTKEDGLIMILGCADIPNCRQSVANLRYMEITEPRFDKAMSTVIIIPKDQTLTLPEVVEKFNHMKTVQFKGFAKLIASAVSQTPIEESKLSFCTKRYIPENSNYHSLFHSLRFYYYFKRDRGINPKRRPLFWKARFSNKQKLEASDCLIKYLLGEVSSDKLYPHLDALKKGRLGRMISYELRKIGTNLDDLIGEQSSANNFVICK